MGLALFLVWGTLLASSSCAVQAQQLALSEAEILQMLKSGESPQQIEALARDYGISFAITEGTSRELRQAGATPELIEVLRTLAPKPVAPPPSEPEPTKPAVLVIESTPGGAQVYLDDEPVGKTSAEGRLKLTQLAPAEHRVRVSHDGHRDYEQKLPMGAGEKIRFVVKLEPLPIAPTHPTTATVPGPVNPQTADPTQPEATVAFLGLKVGPAEGAGLGGVPILEAQPGSPAERAGLRAGQKILMMDGQIVSSPADVVKAVRAHRPGEDVGIVYGDDKSLTKAVVRLGATTVTATEATLPTPPAAIPRAEMPRFTVAHNHNSAASWCYGVMTVGIGKITYRSNTGHSFAFPLNEVREVRKNPMYLRAMKAFHIRMADGSNYNFAVLGDSEWVEPDELFAAIERAGEDAGQSLHERRIREMKSLERRQKRK